MAFVHTRNKLYVENGVQVTNLSFRCLKEYHLDGVRVIPFGQYKREQSDYDLLISHAPNLKHHYLFLKRYGECFPHFIFFFHGHEVLMRSKVYSPPFEYASKSRAALAANDIYDRFKLRVLHLFFLGVLQKSEFVFVSKWMYQEFLKWVDIAEEQIKGRSHVIYNCIAEEFEKNYYNKVTDKEYDFITIRNNIDGSKYCVDIVNRAAYENPEKTFLLIGKGEYFNHYKKAENLIWLPKELSHDEIIKQLQKARCAFMPTRTDAQGVMACEIASFGIPLITSDIPVCHEVFNTFPNVTFVKNEGSMDSIEKAYQAIPKDCAQKIEKYYFKNTGEKELLIIRNMLCEKSDEAE